jgi:hypothetical protein
MGLLTPEEEAAAVAIEFNPVRVGFNGAGDVWTRDVLNLGVRPDALVQAMRARLEAAGGVVLDSTQLLGVEVRPDGAALRIAGGPGGEGSGGGGGAGDRTLAARLVLDCMGHQSPIVRQVRWGVKPDGVCLVVGGCASGFDPERNKTADVICTVSDSAPLGGGRAGGVPLQLFWEAFPSSDGPDSRTTYLFTYRCAGGQRLGSRRLPPRWLCTDGCVWQLPAAFAFHAASLHPIGHAARALSLVACRPTAAAGPVKRDWSSTRHPAPAGARPFPCPAAAPAPPPPPSKPPRSLIPPPPPRSDAQSFRPGLLELFEEYWERLPEYQGVASAEDLRFRRLLFAFFPTYRDSPLRPAFDRWARGLSRACKSAGVCPHACACRHCPDTVAKLRRCRRDLTSPRTFPGCRSVLQIGDASGIQSPLSFGGFGALMRHARRLVGAIDDALACDALTKWVSGAFPTALGLCWHLQHQASLPAIRLLLPALCLFPPTPLPKPFVELAPFPSPI